MKKVMYLLNFILFCCLTAATAQVGGTGTGGTGTGTGGTGLTGGGGLPNQISLSTGGGHEVQGNCVYEQEYYILLANLDILNGSVPASTCVPDISNNLCDEPLPIGYPTMKFRFILNGTTVVIEPTIFELVAPETDTTPSLYGFSYYMNKAIGAQCAKDDPAPIPIYGSSEILTDGPNGTLVPYPICSYTAPGDIFTCDYFAETAGYCIPNSKDCSNLTLSSYSFSGAVGCNNCQPIEAAPNEIPKDSIPKTPTFKKHNPDDLLLSKELLLEVSPNPFNEKINIRLEHGFSGIQLKIFDTTGRVVKSRNALDWSQGASWDLDTSDLPQGMYILHVSNGREEKFVKLVKP